MITCVFEDGGQASLRHAVIDTLVLKDDKLLMVRRSGKLLEGGKWGLIGGFADRDETIKQAAEREVFEETGWKIKDLTLLTIIDRPDRPKEDRQNISFVFFCQADKQTGKPDWESDELKWFSLDELPDNQNIAFDHALSIELYKTYLKQGHQLPVLS